MASIIYTSLHQTLSLGLYFLLSFYLKTTSLQNKDQYTYTESIKMEKYAFNCAICKHNFKADTLLYNACPYNLTRMQL